ncbi:MAG: penicillin-binding protein 1B [Gammaproteobacteria bacterium]|nr:MAG: penicillin-binding protein 1B [Gammaproteobacteria bacterium]
MARRKKRGRRKSRRRTTRRRSLGIRIVTIMAMLLAGYLVFLDFHVRQQFDGKRWSLPARVYARPLELYVGLALTPEQLASEFSALSYRSTAVPRQPGQVSRNRGTFHIITRPFVHSDGQEASSNIRVRIANGQVARLDDAGSGRPISLVRLDPVMVGSFYPSHNEDRVLVKLEEVPATLIEALIAVEDRNFYRHSGIAPKSIMRALLANIRAGGVVQGGSTLTQQLVKNFYLTSERTVTRKLNEAIMALMLEWHYEKNEILEAYLNEVYLGQDGQRAVHGFGLASHFYFGRPLSELGVEQTALLVGLVKGPSYYNPRRHADRARSRRNLVLDVMGEGGQMKPEQVAQAKSRKLGVVPYRKKAINTFPAFLELVRRQLERDYREDDITSEGLRIFTTLDPQIQWHLEQVLDRRLSGLEQASALKGDTLQAAAVVTSIQGGEVLALAGDRHAKFAGFNRALNAQRQVGSVIKPAAYLTALEQPDKYTLATLLDDDPLTWTAPNGTTWSPNNYDRQFHGKVPLYSALMHSYNVATARLGLEIGIKPIISTLQRLGVDHDFRPYPSLVLGAAELTPLQVTQMYQTLASGGFRAPLRAIRAVLAADGMPLQSYPLRVKAAVKPATVYLVMTALRHAARNGTGRSLYQVLPESLDIAGKTGTTDDLRDSWFAGYTGDRLAVVWVGRDDNGPTGLTGSSGALLVWRDLFARLGDTGLLQAAAEDIETIPIDPVSGLRADTGCRDAVELPFIQDSGPAEWAPCADGGSQFQRPVDWFKELFE